MSNEAAWAGTSEPWPRKGLPHVLLAGLKLPPVTLRSLLASPGQRQRLASRTAANRGSLRRKDALADVLHLIQGESIHLSKLKGLG